MQGYGLPAVPAAIEWIVKLGDFKFSEQLSQGYQKLGFAECTPIQEKIIPLALEGKDVSGLAPTGTGKTAAFLLPLMERVFLGKQDVDSPRAFSDWKIGQFVLILVPTRELAEQIAEQAGALRGATGLTYTPVYGGVPIERQIKALGKNGVDFLIATPGRLLDLYRSHKVDFKQVRAMVFDEADRMFDMGFRDDMTYILKRVPRERQLLLFSATLNFDVLNTAYRFGAEPVEVNLSRELIVSANVDAHIYHVGEMEKPAHLLSLLNKYKPHQAIIFSNFKMKVDRLSRFLVGNGFNAVGISSLLSQNQRQRVMEQFKGDSKHNLLVATDVAARGLDIEGVDLVINYELSDDPENYVHRIGRTGRAQKKGIAMSLVSDRDLDALTRIESYLKHKVEQSFLEDSDLIKEFKPMPSDDNSRSSRPKTSPDKLPKRARPKRVGSGGQTVNQETRAGRGSTKKKVQSRRPNKEKVNRKSTVEKPAEKSSEGRTDRKKARQLRGKNRVGATQRRSGSRTLRQSSSGAQKTMTLGQKVSNFFRNIFRA